MKNERFGFALETIIAPGNPQHTHPLDYPEILGSFTTLHRIEEHFGAPSVYMFSRVSGEAELPRKVEQGNVLGWLAFQRFTAKTGIPVSQILFCTEGGEPTLCREREITCFVGTALSVLDSLTSVAMRFLFFPCGGVRPRLKQHPGIELTASWSELTRQLGLPEEEGNSEATTASPAELSYVSQVVPFGADK